jgi:multicomponent Na+:H+ antiporter subunit A
VAVAGSAVFIAVAYQVGLRPFWGSLRETMHEPHAPSPALLLGPALLGLTGAVLGILPGLAEPLAAPAADAALGTSTNLHLKLWHGFNLPLALSGAAVAVGLALCLTWDRFGRIGDRLAPVGKIGPAGAYEAGLRGLIALARAQSRLLQHGYLRLYMLMILGVTVLLIGGMLATGEMHLPADWASARPHEFLLAGVIVLAAVTTVRSQSWLSAVAALGVVGFGVAAVFILFGAPDLAMTQFLVETLTVILFVLIIYHLPKLARLPSRRFEAIRLLTALAVGGVMALLTLAASAEPGVRDISDYYMRASLPEGFGRNVVNVILVDFRVLDTLGEITVIAMAGLGVYALVQMRQVRAGRRNP